MKAILGVLLFLAGVVLSFVFAWVFDNTESTWWAGIMEFWILVATVASLILGIAIIIHVAEEKTP